MAITLSSGAVAADTPEYAKATGIKHITFSCTGTYVAGGITGVQTAIQAITNQGGLTVVDAWGRCDNGTVFYPAVFIQATGAALLLNGTGDLAGGTNLAGYTLRLAVIYE